MESSNNLKTIAFFGATVGCGLSALRHSLAAGHSCVVLVRNPKKLAALIPVETTPNLKVIEGNAHDVNAVTKCLYKSEDNKTLVDLIISTIGSRPKGLSMSPEDPQCCRVAAGVLREAMGNLKAAGATGNPHIVAFSTTGLSKFGRDYPLVLFPIYGWLLKAAHEDKEIMEDRIIGSGLPYTIVRASLLKDGATDKEVRVGIEDPKTGRESLNIGYFISREDAGKWVAENFVFQDGSKYVNKIAMITT